MSPTASTGPVRTVRHPDGVVELRLDDPGRGNALDLLHLGVDPVEDRRHVHVADAAETDHHCIALNAASAAARFG